jgi:hypothetical protein
MIGSKPQPRDVPRSPTDDASIIGPDIVNGLTVRPRKQVNVWLYGLFLLPDFAALLILVSVGVHRLMRYLDTKRKNEG